MSEENPIHFPVPRRVLIEGGLATFATIMMSRTLSGCGGDDTPALDSGMGSADAARSVDAAAVDAAAVDGASRADAAQGIDSAIHGDSGSALDSALAADSATTTDSAVDSADANTGIDAAAEDAAVNLVPADFPNRSVPMRPALVSRIGEIGALQPAVDGIRLPAGFTARVIATTGQLGPGGSYRWHAAPDGGATYITEDGGWIYVSNSEVTALGGVGAVRFDSRGNLVSAYSILSRTNRNCAGGPTPWHTWLSCEETDRGQVYECDPWGEHPAVVRPALGTFKHEAVAVDTVRGHLYLTEDETDGRFYRFIPDGLNAAGQLNLRSGRLEVAVVGMMGDVTWAEVPDPQFTGATPTRRQVATSRAFNGGEGIWYHQDTIYFSTKGDNRIWSYHIPTSRISTLYEPMGGSPILTGVDNVVVSCCGDVLVAEDGGDMQIVAIVPSAGGATLIPLLQVETMGSEITGPAFDPSGTRLYFSSQRNPGVTYEVTGPFHAPAPVT